MTFKPVPSFHLITSWCRFLTACTSPHRRHPCDGCELDLQLAFHTSTGVPVFVAPGEGGYLCAEGASPQLLLPLAETFASLLLFLANLAGPQLAPALHLFVDARASAGAPERPSVFAFNSGGALWFSLRAFAELHQLPDPHGRGVPSVWAPECTCFWLVTLAHELAHNLAPGHDARHETLMERMLEAYFPRLVHKHAELALHNAAAGGRLPQARPPPQQWQPQGRGGPSRAQQGRGR